MDEISASFPDPALSLAIFAGVVLLAALFLWPSSGLIARRRRNAGLSERVRLEDGVKHLYTAEATQHPASVESLAGAIGVSRDRAVDIVRHLERMNLAKLGPESIGLTDEGRAYALRIVRTHRIWERYLADRTGVKPADWHAEAERLEHGLPQVEVDRLAASMGHPLYDPHGDPIPTASGALPPPRGKSLSVMPPGSNVRVVHIEDEPEEVYRGLTAAGITLGSRLRLDRIDATGLHVTVDGRSQMLDALYARNLTVEPVDPDQPEEGIERLHVLQPGEAGVVVRVRAQVQGAQRRRLLDLGIVPDTVVRAELSSLSGDPMAYRIRGAVIALRRAQAEDILIRRLPQEASR